MGGLLLLLLLTTTTTASARAKDDPNEVLRGLLEWIDREAGDADSPENLKLLRFAGEEEEEEEEGGAPKKRFFRDVANKDLELREAWNDAMGSFQRGLFAGEDWQLPSGGGGPSRGSSLRVVVAVPPRLLMTPATAVDRSRSEPLASALWALRDGTPPPASLEARDNRIEYQGGRSGERRNRGGEALFRSNATILALHLQCELAKGPSSWWYPYLRSLPRRTGLAAHVGAYFGGAARDVRVQRPQPQLLQQQGGGGISTGLNESAGGGSGEGGEEEEEKKAISTSKKKSKSKSKSKSKKSTSKASKALRAAVMKKRRATPVPPWPESLLGGSPSLAAQVVAKRRDRDRYRSLAERFLGRRLADACGADSGWWWNENDDDDDDIDSDGEGGGDGDGDGRGKGGGSRGGGSRGGGGFAEAFADAHALATSRQAWNLAGVPLSGGLVAMPTLTPLLDLLNHRAGAARYTPLLSMRSPDALAFAITEQGKNSSKSSSKSESASGTFILRPMASEASSSSTTTNGREAGQQGVTGKKEKDKKGKTKKTKKKRKGVTGDGGDDGNGDEGDGTTVVPTFGETTFTMVPSLRPGSEIFHDYDGGFEEGGFGLGQGAGIEDGELNNDTPPPACAIEVLATFGFAPTISVPVPTPPPSAAEGNSKNSKHKGSKTKTTPTKTKTKTTTTTTTTSQDGKGATGDAAGEEASAVRSEVRLADDRACALLHFGGLVRLRDVAGESATGRRLLETCRAGNGHGHAGSGGGGGVGEHTEQTLQLGEEMRREVGRAIEKAERALDDHVRAAKSAAAAAAAAFAAAAAAASTSASASTSSTATSFAAHWRGARDDDEEEKPGGAEEVVLIQRSGGAVEFEPDRSDDDDDNGNDHDKEPPSATSASDEAAAAAATAPPPAAAGDVDPVDRYRFSVVRAIALGELKVLRALRDACDS